MTPRILANLLPKSVRSGGLVRDAYVIMAHILRDYGWLKSKRAGRCLDARGEPVPWFTYPAIDFIRQLDLRELSIFEYGSGASTLFWAKRARNVVSIEHDVSWFKEISTQTPENTKVILASDGPEAYAMKIVEHGKFDIIIIDGTGESRLLCCKLAPVSLNPGGFIILDNSDLWQESAAVLRSSNLIQIDFTGPAPLDRDWFTTSLFLSRQYAIRPIGDHQPHKSVAQPANPWPGA